MRRTATECQLVAASAGLDDAISDQFADRTTLDGQQTLDDLTKRLVLTTSLSMFDTTVIIGSGDSGTGAMTTLAAHLDKLCLIDQTAEQPEPAELHGTLSEESRMPFVIQRHVALSGFELSLQSGTQREVLLRTAGFAEDAPAAVTVTRPRTAAQGLHVDVQLKLLAVQVRARLQLRSHCKSLTAVCAVRQAVLAPAHCGALAQLLRAFQRSPGAGTPAAPATTTGTAVPSPVGGAVQEGRGSGVEWGQMSVLQLQDEMQRQALSSSIHSATDEFFDCEDSILRDAADDLSRWVNQPRPSSWT